MPPQLKTFDFYRKIPLDLTESTLQGSLLSCCALSFMVMLFVCELWAFLSPEVYSTVMLDSNKDSKLRINFNITMLELPCDYASVDVLDVLGTNRVNVTKNIVKWHTDNAGKRQEFHGRNREQDDVAHDEHHRDLALAHEDGEHAVPLDAHNFKDFLAGNEYTIVDFYAPWCIWCQKLAPTWEAFAEEVEEQLPELRVVKVDCATNRDLCHEHNIHAFPTIRFFRREKAEESDYKKDRSLVAFMEYTGALVQGDEGTLRRYVRPNAKEHPGCQLSGFIMVNRVPGNFHVEAHSKHHNINDAQTNVSHVVNSLSFGTLFPTRSRFGANLQLEGLTEVVNEVFVTEQLHSAPHHYIKVVSTFLGKEWSMRGDRDVLQYQMIVSSQTMPYEEGDVPEAKFSYDLAPMSVHVKQRTRRWYDFITSVMAIVGGTFTVVGVFDALAYRVFKQKKI